MTTTTTAPSPGARQTGTGEDWKSADYDSFEVLVLVGASDPIDRVSQARRARRQERTAR